MIRKTTSQLGSMMDVSKYLDECKEKLNISSTYGLSKAMNIPENVLHYYYKGERSPDEYACFKMAEILQIDPAVVIAEIKTSTEKNPVKREYFKVFRGASRKAGAAIILALALSLSLLSAHDGGSRLEAAYKAVYAASAAFFKSLILRIMYIM